MKRLPDKKDKNDKKKAVMEPRNPEKEWEETANSYVKRWFCVIVLTYPD
jgi:hypothetical protein